MKSILIIGMGRFGHHLCKKLIELKNEVLVVDEEEEKISDVLTLVTRAKIGDCTNPDVIRGLGVKKFDICFVCIGTNFQSSLEITSLLKEEGAKYVVSKANRDIQAKFLLRNGADEVIYPDRDMADRIATRFSADNVFDYIDFGEEYSICEIPVKEEWIGKSIKEVDFRAAYQINILGCKINEVTHMLPMADHVFVENEHLTVIGLKEDIENVLKQL